jgi:DNA modification methylase
MSKSHRKTIFDVIGRHTVHPFPARMAPGIVLDILEDTDGPLRVLDPMMGSGTVIATARSRGHRSYGFDLDPLAVLISKVWTTPIDRELVRAKARDVLVRAEALYPATRANVAFPPRADRETQQFLCYWFDGYARRELISLAKCIQGVRNEQTRNALWCGFSRLIVTKQAGASRAMDLAHSRPHRVFERAPISPFEKFLASVERVVENCIEASTRERGPSPKITTGDARATPIPADSIDLIVTSPPYLNAIDYLRCSKFSLVWMGHSLERLRALRSGSIGTEVGLKVRAEAQAVQPIIRDLRLSPPLSERNEAILARYVCDIGSVIAESARVLVPGGRAVYVIGENTVRGTYIRNSLLVRKLAEAAGLNLCKRQTRELPSNRRYLPPPSSDNSSAAIESRMRREVILTFEKPLNSRPN